MKLKDLIEAAEYFLRRQADRLHKIYLRLHIPEPTGRNIVAWIIISLLLFLWFAVVISKAHADDSVYLTASIGRAHYRTVAFSQESMPNSAADEPTAYALGGGYKINSHWAFELTYYDFGGAEWEGSYAFEQPTHLDYTNTFTAYTSGKVYGPALSVLPSIQLREYSLFGRLGVIHATSYSITVLPPQNGQPQDLWNEKVHSNDLLYGFGVEHKSFRVEYVFAKTLPHGDSAYHGVGTLFLSFLF